MTGMLGATLPLVTEFGQQALIVLAAYTVTLGLSGKVVGFFVQPVPAPQEPGLIRPRTREVGHIIGKCENLLVLTFVLLGSYEAIGLIFAAKALARKTDIHDDPGWFLGGTLVNIVWTLLVGVITRLTIVGP
jgi:hypothetical protein